MYVEPIVVAGGFLSHWSFYLRFGGILRELTGQRIFMAKLTAVDWLRSGIANPEGLLAELDRAVVAARMATGSQTVTIVGHSAGGLVARLYLSDHTWRDGRVYGGHRFVGRLITLGTPHYARNVLNRSIADIANRICPGCYYPQVDFGTVAGRLICGRRDGTLAERIAYNSYWTTGGRGDVWGDGLIPVDAALVPGARQVVLDGVAHGPLRNYKNWYGANAQVVRRWWLPLTEQTEAESESA